MEKAYLDEIANQLSNIKDNKILNHFAIHASPLPSRSDLSQIVETLDEIFFPGFDGRYEKDRASLKELFTMKLEFVYSLLCIQIKQGMCLHCHNNSKSSVQCEKESEQIASKFMNSLPLIKALLLKDVLAAYNGDPASKSYEEVIFCYPSIAILTHYRIANQLFLLGADLIARIIMEIAHSQTGIDIHPGAQIGESFFIDHGTGVVIGETAIIGNNVRLYQGVTLGAKSFPLDPGGNPIKGIARHPIIEDNVIIYSNATILGRVVIGENSVIGGNTWVTEDVPANSKLFNSINKNGKEIKL
ncbi:MAG: serine O-acetyltransferase EpsC [bacterium]